MMERMEEQKVRERDEAHVQRAAETSVVSAVMRGRGILADLGQISPGHFADAALRKAWSAVVEDASIDDALALQIAVPDLDGRQCEAVASTSHSRDTVLRARNYLLESRTRRDLRRLYEDGIAALDSKGRTAADVAADTRRLLADMSQSATTSQDAREVALALQQQEQSDVVPTGIRAVDFVCYGGLHYGLLTGAFARYKVGKTVLMATIARNLERHAIPTLMVTLERRKNDVERFIVARALGIDARDLDLKGNDQHKAAFEEYLADTRSLRYVHRPGITIDELRSIILAEVSAHGVKVVLVDYWQLITNINSRSSQQEKQQEAAQMLADLASDLDIAIIVTGQLNQEGQPRGGEGILASAGIVFKIERAENSEYAHVHGMVSNKGPVRISGTPDNPSMTLSPIGPHYEDWEHSE